MTSHASTILPSRERAPFPLDLVFLVKRFVHSDPQTHLALAGVSKNIRQNLYASDESWKEVCMASAFGRTKTSSHFPSLDQERTWKQVAIEVAKDKRVDGLLSRAATKDWEDYSEDFKDMIRDFKATDRVFSVRELKKEKPKLATSPNLTLFDVPWLVGLDELELRYTEGKGREIFLDHPAAFQSARASLAVLPAVSELILSVNRGGPSATAKNADGVTCGDCAVALQIACSRISSSSRQILEENTSYVEVWVDERVPNKLHLHLDS